MLAIKLKRIGKKGQASFRVIISEKKSKLNGRFVEDLGWLNPRNKILELNKERVSYWLKIGAQPTPTVHNLLVKNGLLDAPKIAVHKLSKNKKEAAEIAAVSAPVEAPAGKPTTS